MGNNKDKNMELLKETFKLCILFVIAISFLTFNNFKDGHYREWLIMIIGLMATVFGGFLTFAGVILTLNRTLDMNIELEKKSVEKNVKEKDEKKIKLKLLLLNEIETLMRYYESKVLFYLMQKIRCSEFIEVIGDEESVYKCESYKLDPKFKEYIYELLMLESSENNKRIKELLEFYNNYNYFNLMLEKESSKELDFERDLNHWISFLISRRYMSKELNNKWDSINNILDKYFDKDKYIKDKTKYDIEKINKIIKQFNDGKLHCNENIENILEYLQ